eukprot:1158106-Pelagomonas_calceolata.AAC.10
MSVRHLNAASNKLHARPSRWLLKAPRAPTLWQADIHVRGVTRAISSFQTHSPAGRTLIEHSAFRIITA